MKRSPRRWWLLGGIWWIYFCFGLVSASMAPLVEPIRAALGLSHTAMGAVLGAWPLVYIAAALPAGAALDRFGTARTLLVASLLIALSAALRSQANGFAMLFAAVGVFGLGGPLISIGGPKLIAEQFGDADRGLAMGLYVTGPSLGAIASLSLTRSVAMPFFDGDWRAVLLAYAAVAASAAVAWLVVGRDPGRGVGQPRTARESQIRVVADLLGIDAIRIVLIASVGVFFFNHGLNNWLPEILRAGGMSAVSAGYWAALPTAVGVVGSLLVPRLARRGRQVPVLIALFVAAGVATRLIPVGEDTVLAAGLVLQGVARGAMMAVCLLVLMDNPRIGPRRMGSAGGLFFSAGEIGGILGPIVIGWSFDRTGGFGAALELLSGVCVALALLALWLGKVNRAGHGAATADR